MALSRIVSEINGDFGRKSKIFQTPVHFAPLLKGVPLGIGYRRWDSKTTMMELPGRTRSLTISSAVWIQDTNVTGGHTGRQQRPRLCIVPCGKNDDK